MRLPAQRKETAPAPVREAGHVASGLSVKRVSPPVVASGLSGFVLGIVATLLAIGVVGHSAGGKSPAPTLPPVTSVSVGQMEVRVTRIVDRQLGPAGYPAPRKSRLIHVSLVPAIPEVGSSPPGPGMPDYQSVFIVFRLNDHPFGRAWRLRAAKADVFGVLKALYTSQLPIYDVEMDGMFPLRSGTSVRDQRTVIARIDHHTAEQIPWKRWGRDQEGRLWSSLSYRYVNTRFA